jgi:hypothetical protein
MSEELIKTFIRLRIKWRKEAERNISERRVYESVIDDIENQFGYEMDLLEKEIKAQGEWESFLRGD